MAEKQIVCVAISNKSYFKREATAIFKELHSTDDLEKPVSNHVHLEGKVEELKNEVKTLLKLSNDKTSK